MSKIRALILAGLAAATVVVLPAASGTATAHADPCVGSWHIGVGGLSVSGSGTGQDSRYIASDQPVGYNSADPASGYNELGRLFWQHRNDCPGDHIEIVGHSEGAAIVHQWVADNQGAGNFGAVLLADPKRAAGPGSGGSSDTFPFNVSPWPVPGKDANFGDVPVLEVCNHDDIICESDAGWYGYLTGRHTAYDFNSYDYADDVSGIWYQ